MKCNGWGGRFEYRKVIRRRFPDFWKIPVSKRTIDVIIQHVKEGNWVLDIGAFDRSMEDKLKRYFPSLNYMSLDVDRGRYHDYYRLEQVDRPFDMVLLLEVIEHCDLEEGLNLIMAIHGILRPEGKLILTTPNLFHPNRFWSMEHKVPYRYDELGGLLMEVGFEVNHIFRIYNDQFLKRWIRLKIASFIHRYLDVDFARSILICASKVGEK
jgi:SAM-dependent methyltransferase